MLRWLQFFFTVCLFNIHSQITKNGFGSHANPVGRDLIHYTFFPTIFVVLSVCFVLFLKAEECSGIKIFQSNTSIYFANSDLYVSALKAKVSNNG